jgi:hypothetical protein
MVALDATGKRFGNAGFRERLLKNVARVARMRWNCESRK